MGVPDDHSRSGTSGRAGARLATPVRRPARVGTGRCSPGCRGRWIPADRAVPDGRRPVQSAVLHEFDEHVQIVIVRHSVATSEPAVGASMYQHESLGWLVADRHRWHPPAAPLDPIAWTDVDMLGRQAERAVVPITPRCQRWNFVPTEITGESGVLCSATDGALRKLK